MSAFRSFQGNGHVARVEYFYLLKRARTPQGEVAVSPSPALWSVMLRTGTLRAVSESRWGPGGYPGGGSQVSVRRGNAENQGKPRALLLEVKDEPEEVSGTRTGSGPRLGEAHTGWGTDPATRSWAFVPEMDIMSL